MNPLFLLIGAGILLNWLISDPEKTNTEEPNQDNAHGNSTPERVELENTQEEIPVSQTITLDVLREIFQNGARPLKRRDAVELLKGAPYFIPKTNAYRALAPSRRFAGHLREDGQGWIYFEPSPFSE